MNNLICKIFGHNPDNSNITDFICLRCGAHEKIIWPRPPANEEMILKTSEEWQEIYKNQFIIMDPDGWDRSPEGWQYSWYEELISEQEFIRRMRMSTCEYKVIPL